MWLMNGAHMKPTQCYWNVASMHDGSRTAAKYVHLFRTIDYAIYDSGRIKEIEQELKRAFPSPNYIVTRLEWDATMQSFDL